MAFDITIAYAVTLFAVNSLAYLAVRNHRSGWRRERSNAFLDILITWANAKAEMRSPQESTGSIAGTTIEPDLLTQQLSALQLALNVNAGTTPRLQTVRNQAVKQENLQATRKIG